MRSLAPSSGRRCSLRSPSQAGPAAKQRCRTPAKALLDVGHNDIYAAPGDLPLLDKSFALAGGGAAAVSATSRSQKPRTPPPDIPSLMLDARIVYLGMPLVPAVTELIVSELLYLQYADRIKPVFIYINSTGTTRADGETVGFETEGTAIYDTMCYLKNQINTVGIGVAYGQSAMLLSAGTPGRRFMMEHATAMLQQPQVPQTGARQAIEVQIRWREAHAQYQTHLEILSKTTGHTVEKLDYDMQRPLYMTPRDAIEYNLVDKVVPKPRKKGGKGGDQGITDSVNKFRKGT